MTPKEKPAPQRRVSLRDVQADLNSGTDPKKVAAAVTVTPPDQTPPAPEPLERVPAEKPERTEPFNYDKWYESQPIEARTQFAKNVVGNYESEIKKVYSPEVFALLEEAGSNPVLLKKLQRASKDKDLRTFLFDTAIDIYGDPATPSASEADSPKPKYVQDLETQVQGLQTERENERTAQARNAYTAQRQAEHAALMREFPELKYDATDQNSPAFKRMAMIIDQTEKASQAAGRVLPYRDTYEAMNAAWRDTDTTAKNYVIPRTTTTTEPLATRQAPQNERDVRQRMKETIDRQGSFSGLAAAIARGKN